MAYNFAKRLKLLKGLTPYGFICQQWQKQLNDLSMIRPITLWDCTPGKCLDSVRAGLTASDTPQTVDGIGLYAY